jgi:hypothetical protein
MGSGQVVKHYLPAQGMPDPVEVPYLPHFSLLGLAS